LVIKGGGQLVEQKPKKVQKGNGEDRAGIIQKKGRKSL
jgi:hypothetical protein